MLDTLKWNIYLDGNNKNNAVSPKGHQAHWVNASRGLYFNIRDYLGFLTLILSVRY